MRAEEGLSASRERELWRRFKAAGDPRAREELIELHMPLARRMAARYAGVAEPFDDLLQVASLGLVNAVDRFDPARGVPFRGFAKPTIHGELKRHFRDRTWTVRVPRSLHDLLAKVERANEEAIGMRGRAASVEELSVQLGVDRAEILEALEAGHNRSTISLDAPRPGSDPDVAGAEWIGRPDEALELVEDRVALRDILPVLDRRGQEILRLRFVEDMSQTAIAERVGCSQMQVSRLLRQALDRLREEARPPTRASRRSGGTAAASGDASSAPSA
jgi:RNA polymerase sigma-B factor